MCIIMNEKRKYGIKSVRLVKVTDYQVLQIRTIHKNKTVL